MSDRLLGPNGRAAFHTPSATHGRHVGLVSVVLVTVLSGCLAAEPTTLPLPASIAPSLSPSASVLPTAQPSESAAPAPIEPTDPAPTAATPKPGGLRPDAFATVVTEGIRVRTEPFVGETSLKLEPLLWKGAALYVIDGPTSGSGYDWYLVEPMSEVDLQIHPDPPPPGWVAAASRDGVPWIAPLAVDCYDSPFGWLKFDFTALPMDLNALACFGARPLQFTAALSMRPADGCHDTTGPWTITPRWLAPCPDRVVHLADPESDLTDDARALNVTIGPSVDLRPLPKLEPGQWLIVDVVAQYSHPAASSCQATPTGGDGDGPPRQEVVVLNCREQFVVTSLKVHVDT